MRTTPRRAVLVGLLLVLYSINCSIEAFLPLHNVRRVPTRSTNPRELPTNPCGEELTALCASKRTPRRVEDRRKDNEDEDVSADRRRDNEDEDLSAENQKSHFFSQKSLRDLLGNTDTFRRLCELAGIERPSKIQSLAWPVLSRGEHAIVADQTGSGKTLAYLVPLLQGVLESKAPASGGVVAPRLLILAPTAELADQIHGVCQTLCKPLSLTAMVLTATGNYATNIRDQIRLLQTQRRLDVLVSTPGRIATILRTRHATDKIVNLGSLQAVVLDEVDVLLLDETFGPQLQTIGQATPGDPQFVFVTATLPDRVVNDVKAQFANAHTIKGPGLHRVAPTVRERLIDVSVPNNRDEAAGFRAKSDALLEALRQNRCRRSLVFCNSVTSCRQVVNLLERQDRRNLIYKVLPYHNALKANIRNDNLKAFKVAESKSSHVLVCTDRAARGVDFETVDHVVLFDFPSDPAEYVRRVGRTARAGRDGACTVLAYGWQLPIARSVMRKGKVLDRSMDKSLDFDDDDDEEKEYTGKERMKWQSKRKDTIAENIASGKLWTDR